MREQKSLRLGSGEVTVDWDRVAVARTHFIGVADRLYPDLRKSLEDLLPWFSSTVEVQGLFLLEDWTESLIGDWCKRWSLVDQNRNAVPWAVEMAFKTLDNLRCGYPFVWFIDAGGVTPDVPYNPILGVGRLHRTTLVSLKKETAKKHHAELTAQMKAYRDRGWEKSPRQLADSHWEWAVHVSVGGRSYSDFEQLGYGKRLDPKIISHEVAKVRHLMNWYAPIGRPSRPGR